MKCAIFYMSLKPGKDRQRITLDGQDLWIRVQLSDNADGEYGLRNAEPESGEMVMNSHPIEGDV